MSDTNTEYTTVDLVQQCVDGDAAKAADTLSALLGPKLVDAIQAKKVEVAQSMYGAAPVQDQQSEEPPAEGNEEPANAETEEEHENA
jgi:ribosomal protein L12E/L44/L45/RPP1/RPP2